jgi:hypothetical protein
LAVVVAVLDLLALALMLQEISVAQVVTVVVAVAQVPMEPRVAQEVMELFIYTTKEIKWEHMQ